jgi:SAM-dependent methyltransferase
MSDIFDKLDIRDPADGARWLIARSDIETAWSYLCDQSGAGIAPLKNYIRRYWPQYFNEPDYDRVYQEAGEIEAQVNCYGAIPQTHRFQVVAQAMAQIGRPKKVLDFGCSRAYHAIHLHNLYNQEFTCVDIDKTSIVQARDMIRRAARNPKAMRAEQANDCLDYLGAEYDAVMCLETLEHLREYQSLLMQFEQCVKPGGWIVITLPHGPVEYTMWVEHPERNREHLREFGLQDCYELWSRKPGFYITLFAGGINKYAGMTEGSLIVMYQADRKPCGEVNMDRKVLGAMACVGPELPDRDKILEAA